MAKKPRLGVRPNGVSVYLAPGASADMVRLYPHERTAIEAMAATCGYSAISTFIRDLCLEAALDSIERGDLDDWQLCTEAAMRAGMPLSTWMRDVTLAAIAAIPLSDQILAARRFVRRKAAA